MNGRLDCGLSCRAGIGLLEAFIDRCMLSVELPFRGGKRLQKVHCWGHRHRLDIKGKIASCVLSGVVGIYCKRVGPCVEGFWRDKQNCNSAGH